MCPAADSSAAVIESGVGLVSPDLHPIADRAKKGNDEIRMPSDAKRKTLRDYTESAIREGIEEDRLLERVRYGVPLVGVRGVNASFFT